MIHRSSLRFPILLFALLLPGCAYFNRPSGPPVETGYVTKPYQSQVFGRERKYALFIPKHYNETKRKWPVILFLHGNGERGEDIELAVKHGPVKEARAHGDSEFIIINPQLPAGKVTPDLAKAWQKAEPDILMILNEVRSQYRVDDSRIYLTGLSLGGFGTYLIAADHPELFAACAPLCGGCDPTRAVEFKGMPFWIFHGEKDPVVSANFSKNMYQAMKSAGCDVQLTLYPEALHDCWSETYQNAQLYSWFLSHKLRGR